jgi:uncharacterized membrane protein
MILVSLWALIRGQVTLAPKLKLTGRKARIYGGALLVFTFTLLDPLLTLVRAMMNLVGDNQITNIIFNYGTTFLVIFGVAYLCNFIKVPESNEKDSEKKAS